MTAMTFELEYTVAWNRARGRCGCSVFLPAGQHGGVIVVTELADNPGPSITNAIEAMPSPDRQPLAIEDDTCGYQAGCLCGWTDSARWPLRSEALVMARLLHDDKIQQETAA